ncbi:MAG: hypothetical protein HQL56_03560 [Magnetococcales bacterium]|nr:hypothetical protein [Magnetococcales bacterium]
MNQHQNGHDHHHEEHHDSERDGHEVTLAARGDYGTVVTEFLHRHALVGIVGFSGGADDKLPGLPEGDPIQEEFKEFRKHLEERILRDALGTLRGHHIAVLTGGTRFGVPNTATRVAKEMGFKTIGVYPLTGRKYALGGDLLDLGLCVEPLMGESHWGDECPVWVSLCQGVVVIGGGAGTLSECAHIQKINEGLVKYGRTPKIIVPIHGTGGVADVLPHIWTKPEIKRVSMPSDRVHTGSEAAFLLMERLGLHRHNHSEDGIHCHD